ncbi:MAG: PAS domain S-box protein [Chloroflexi bacterium]|nr:MAG: PAS domain S-box protein [Chloroflexota bacterium]
MVEATPETTAQFYEHLIRHVSEGMVVLDDEGRIVSANEMAERMLGYTQGELIGRFCEEICEDVSFLTDLLVGERELKRNMRHRNGRLLPVSLYITPLTTQSDNRTLLSFSNTADIEQFNEVLTHMERLAGVGILTASVAHELNNPISIIAATCSNLRHEIDTNSLRAESLMRYIDMIEQSAWRCVRIVEVLRNYTANKEREIAVTDLNTIVHDAVTLVKHQFQGEFNVTIQTDLAPDLKTIVCDHNRMTQVLINLLTNARDAMQPEGGTIYVKSWAMPPSPADEFSQQGKPEMLFAISVRDTGHGIPPEIMHRIFDPFFTTKPSGQGTGLGLFIAKRIVAQHNGRIWVENNPDGGATFTIILPQWQ